MVLCLGIVLAAGVAYACPGQTPCGDRYGPERPQAAPPHAEREQRQTYRDPETVDWRGGAGEITLDASFFADGVGGGVGPIPSDDYYSTGVWVIVGSRGHARAFASASARTSVSVRFGGGFHGGGRR
jgi:3',5'-cyclic AMP phosphodiesterase CpdA